MLARRRPGSTCRFEGLSFGKTSTAKTWNRLPMGRAEWLGDHEVLFSFVVHVKLGTTAARVRAQRRATARGVARYICGPL